MNETTHTTSAPASDPAAWRALADRIKIAARDVRMEFLRALFAGAIDPALTMFDQMRGLAWDAEDALSAAADDCERLARERDEAWADLAAVKLLCEITPETTLRENSVAARVEHTLAMRDRMLAMVEASEARRMEDYRAARAEADALRAKIAAVRAHIAERTDGDCDGDSPQWDGGFKAACSQVLAVLGGAALAAPADAEVDRG
jgi:hypothetical protein